MFLEELSLAPETYGQYFFNKHWTLIEGTKDDPFCIGDHPVVLDNDFLRGQPRSRGLNSPGVSIYFPLTPMLCLVLIDMTVVEGIEAKYQEAKRTYGEYKRAFKKNRGRIGPEADRLLVEQKQLVEETYRLLRPILNGTPSVYSDGVVMRANSLQVEYAERWIVSSRKDFLLPQQMIADDESYKGGRAFVWR